MQLHCCRRFFAHQSLAYRLGDYKQPPSLFEIRKAFMKKSCEEAASSPLMIILQNNSLDSFSAIKLRYQFKKLGISLKVVSPSIMKEVIEEKHPEMKPLSNILFGPTMVMYSSQSPDSLRPAMKILKAEPRLLVVAGKYESLCLGHSGITELFYKLASRETLQGELLGVLNMTGIGLTQSLVQSQQRLVSILSQRTE